MPIAILSGARTKKILAALEGNWQAEMEGFHSYTTLADRDADPVRAQVLRHMAQSELEHAALWEGRITWANLRRRDAVVYKGGPRRRCRFAC